MYNIMLSYLNKLKITFLKKLILLLTMNVRQSVDLN